MFTNRIILFTPTIHRTERNNIICNFSIAFYVFMLTLPYCCVPDTEY